MNPKTYRLLPLPHPKPHQIDGSGAEKNHSTAPLNLPPTHFLKEAIFSAGNFWELEASFCRSGCEGLLRTAAGYFGGSTPKPNYKEVMEGKTGHTEAVKVTYDRRKITYKSLCKLFFESHDPTNKDYLSFGAGTHHRSAIFYGSEDEKKQAQESKVETQMKLNRRIVTKIVSANTSIFYLAESRNQKYYLQQENQLLRLCECLSLRSERHFADSSIAFKLNGIFSADKKNAEESLTKFLSENEMAEEAKKILAEILCDLKLTNALEQWI